jgi:hypothetical protein
VKKGETTMPIPHALAITLSGEQRTALERLVRAHSTPQSLGFRARIILRAADCDHPTNLSIAFEFACSKNTVTFWRKRFVQQGIDGLKDASRSGRPRIFSPLATP